MTGARRLYELQNTDLMLESSKRVLGELSSKIGDDSDILEIKGKLNDIEESLREIQEEQRETDALVLASREKTQMIEQRLYGGTVRNPKELEDLDRDLRNLKDIQSDIEGRALDVMLRSDDVENELAAHRSVLKEREAAWVEEQNLLRQRYGAAQSEVLQLENQRQQIERVINKVDMALYGRLWNAKRGYPVARLVRDICEGCRLVLPTREAQRVKTMPGLIQCSSCNRILYPG